MIAFFSILLHCVVGHIKIYVCCLFVFVGFFGGCFFFSFFLLLFFIINILKRFLSNKISD